MTVPLAEAHDTLRPLMFSVAYRMLGSVAEAEDVVQEAFLRLHRSAPDDVVNLEAYATTVTTRLALDTLRSARVRRETYVGPWLPEPVVDSLDADPAHRVELDDTVSTAFLLLLETLTPVERAVFVLREAMGYEYREIAEVVDKSEANCRQILARARRRVDDGSPRFEATPRTATGSPPGSSPRSRAATSRASNGCSPTTWCSSGTAAAAPRRSAGR